MTLYKDIIKTSWINAIRNKYLWFFGLFAMLLGSGGEYEIFYKLNNKSGEANLFEAFIDSFITFGVNLGGVKERLWEDPGVTLGILLIGLFFFLLFVFIVWLSNVSQIAIVDANYKISRGNQSDLKEGVTRGVKFFWPVFTINITLKILIMGVLGILIYVSNSLMYAVLSLLILIFLLSISFIAKYAIAYVVIRGQKLSEALISALKLFKKFWLVSVELALILLTITFVMIILIALTLFLVAALGLGIIDLFQVSFPGLAMYMSLFVIASVLFVFAYLLTLLSVFQINAWTNLFIELDVKGAISKIERIIKGQ
jgi:hypothetical protein